MIRVASYCRVSTDKEDQANSFISQKQFFQTLIGTHPDWELYRIYADEGITGTSTKKRREFNRMIQDAYEGKFQLIITKEISRFSRNILDTLQYTRKLRARGVGVFFLTENLNSLDPEAELLMTIMGTIAQEESRKISQRVKWGQTRRMESGVVFGRSLLGYRVENGALVIEPEGAALVRLIFQKYTLEKKGTSIICRELETEGYCNAAGNNKWHPSHIIKILKNEKYAGDLVQKKSITPNYLDHVKKANRGEEQLIVLRDHHDPIISRPLWEATQQELSRRKTGRQSNQSKRHSLSGKIRCGECGAGFVARTKWASSGNVYLKWCCARGISGGKGTCTVGKHLRDEDAVNMVRDSLRSLPLELPEILDEVSKYASAIIHSEYEIKPEHIRWEIRNLERKIRAVMDAYFAKEISREEMLEWKQTYESRAAHLRTSLQSIEAAGDQKDLIAMTHQNLERLLTAHNAWAFLGKHLVDRITVYGDRHMELKFRNISHVFIFDEECI